MRKWQSLLLMLFMLFFSSSIYAYAAVPALPERTGVVNDQAGLFPADQAKQLEDGLKGSSYELVVLTARGLNEEDVQQLGNDAYNTWKLGSHQLLLLVTADPSSVHLVYDNEQMAEAVSRSEVSNNQGIIDLNYKPQAAIGSPVAGIIAISNYMNALNVPLPTTPTAASPTGSITLPPTAAPSPTMPTAPLTAGESTIPAMPLVPAPAAPIGGVPIPTAPPSSLDAAPAETNAAFSGYKPLSAGTLFTIAGIILFGCIALFIVRRSMLNSRTRKVLQEAKALQSDAESKINK